MKFVIRAAILSFILLSHFQMWGQLNLDLRNTDLLEIIKTIEKQSDFRFSYDEPAAKSIKIDRFTINDGSIEDVLNQLENEAEFTFVRAGNLIGIKILESDKDDSDDSDLKSDQELELSMTQQIELSGSVTDMTTAAPLIGAAVISKKNGIGTITDIDGQFYINLPEDSEVLIVSYVGYQDKEIDILNKSVINVELKPVPALLDEVIVIGYTEKKIKDLTGSVGVVQLDGIETQPLNSIEQAIQGRVAGVQVTNDGAPGGGISVRIRGYGTLGDNEPLYIIDGVPTKSGLNQFSINDFASVQVLKDAAATAIYGARAANGVVILTTKKGDYQSGQKITFDSYIGMQEATNLPEMLNTQEYADLFWQAQKNSGLIPSNEVFGMDRETPMIPEFLDAAQTIPSNQEGTAWLDELFAPALIHSYSLGYQSGNEQSRVALSATYFEQEGILQYTDFDRYTIRSNTEIKSKNDIIKIGQNLTLSYSDIAVAPANAALGSRIIHAYRMNPIVPLRDINGNWASSVKGVQGAENPVALSYFDRNDERISSRIFANAYLSVTPIPDLVLKTDLGVDYDLFNFKNYSPRFKMGDAERAVNSFQQVNSTSLNWVWNNTLKYKKDFGSHHLSGLIGSEAIRFRYDEFGATRDSYFTDDLDYVYLSSGEGQQTNFGGGTRWAIFSLFGRLDYDFADKYLVGASVRRDGSSRFSASNRFALFPAVSIGWRLSSESFLQPLSWLDDLKLRASWGQSGNQEIGDFAAFSSFATNSNNTNYDLNGLNNSVVTGFAANRLGNPNIVWETTTQTNIGLDASLFDYRLTFSTDFFLKNTEDILLQRPTLAIEGNAEAPFTNAGRMKNMGVEFQMAYRTSPVKDFSYEVSANATIVRNEVLELADDIKFIPGFISNTATRNLTISRTEVSLPIAQLYGHVVEGIFNSQTEVNSHAEQVGKGIGRLKFKDLNNDGVINDDDRTVIGNPHPDLMYGLNFKANYKQLDFSLFIQGVQGVDLYNFTRYYTDFYFDLGNRHKRILDAWSPNNTNATIPRIASVDINNELRPSTYFVEDGSFLRVKNLQIGYTFPMNRGKLRMYLQGNNIFTITDYQGIDPEVSLFSYNSRDRNLDLGVDRGIYPNSSVYTFGINLEL